MVVYMACQQKNINIERSKIIFYFNKTNEFRWLINFLELPDEKRVINKLSGNFFFYFLKNL